MIEAEHLTKYYANYPAIEDVSFVAAPGEILGFLGPNGAGKTTTMRILAGFMAPTSGAARIDGQDTVQHSHEARKRLGYLPESVPLYTDMSVKSYLDYMGILRDMDRKRRKRRVDEAMDLAQIAHYSGTLIGRLSKGYRQRVGIAQAILHEPPVLILDEPTNGIDPTQVVDTRRIIKSLGKSHTILLSSHVLPEVSMICDRVVIMHEGQIVADGQPDELAHRLGGIERFDLEARGPAVEVEAAIKAVDGVVDVTLVSEGDSSTFRVQVREGARAAERLPAAVLGGGWVLLRFAPVTMSLEEVFMKLTTEDPADDA